MHFLCICKGLRIFEQGSTCRWLKRLTPTIRKTRFEITLRRLIYWEWQKYLENTAPNSSIKVLVLTRWFSRPKNVLLKIIELMESPSPDDITATSWRRVSWRDSTRRFTKREVLSLWMCIMILLWRLQQDQRKGIYIREDLCSCFSFCLVAHQGKRMLGQVYVDDGSFKKILAFRDVGFQKNWARKRLRNILSSDVLCLCSRWLNSIMRQKSFFFCWSSYCLWF